MAKDRFFTFNEVRPVELDPQPTMIGLVHSRDIRRQDLGIFEYTVVAQHPVTHAPMLIAGVRERIDVFYKRQTGQIAVNETVHIARARDGRWEITKVEVQEGSARQPTVLQIGPHDSPTGRIFASQGIAEIVLGDAIIRSTNLNLAGTIINNVEITAGQWTELFKGSTWILTNGSIEFTTVEILDANGVPFSIFKVTDPKRGGPGSLQEVHVATIDPLTNRLWDDNVGSSNQPYGCWFWPVISRDAVYEYDSGAADGSPERTQGVVSDLFDDDEGYEVPFNVPGIKPGKHKVEGWVVPPNIRPATQFRMDHSSTVQPGDLAGAVTPAAQDRNIWGPPVFDKYRLWQETSVPRFTLRPGTHYVDTIESFTWTAPGARDTSTSPPTGLPAGWDPTKHKYEDILYTLEESTQTITNKQAIRDALDDTRRITLQGFQTVVADVPGDADGTATMIYERIIQRQADNKAEVIGGAISLGTILTVVTGGAAAAGVAAIFPGSGAILAGTAAPLTTLMSANVGALGFVSVVTAGGIPVLVVAPAALTAASTAVIATSAALIPVGVGVFAAGVAGAGAETAISAEIIKSIEVRSFKITAVHPLFGRSAAGLSYFINTELEDGYEYRTVAS